MKGFFKKKKMLFSVAAQDTRFKRKKCFEGESCQALKPHNLITNWMYKVETVSLKVWSHRNTHTHTHHISSKRSEIQSLPVYFSVFYPHCQLCSQSAHQHQAIWVRRRWVSVYCTSGRRSEQGEGENEERARMLEMLPLILWPAPRNSPAVPSVTSQGELIGCWGPMAPPSLSVPWMPTPARVLTLPSNRSIW